MLNDRGQLVRCIVLRKVVGEVLDRSCSRDRNLIVNARILDEDAELDVIVPDGDWSVSDSSLDHKKEIFLVGDCFEALVIIGGSGESITLRVSDRCVCVGDLIGEGHRVLANQSGDGVIDCVHAVWLLVEATEGHADVEGARSVVPHGRDVRDVDEVTEDASLTSQHLDIEVDEVIDPLVLLHLGAQLQTVGAGSVAQLGAKIEALSRRVEEDKVGL